MAPISTSDINQASGTAPASAPAKDVKQNGKVDINAGKMGGKVKSSGGRAFVLGPNSINWEIEKNGNAEYPPCSRQDYLPSWSYDWLGPIEPFEFSDPALRADPSYPILTAAGARIKDVTGVIGAEVHGLDIASLSPAGKDELAHLIATKHVVAFREQKKYLDLPVGEAIDWARHFGKLHTHPTSSHPEGHKEIHLVHRGAGDKRNRRFFDKNMFSTQWHHDLPFEDQPAGYTFMYGIDHPQAGHDTLFGNMDELYDRLSDAMQQRMHGLKASYSSRDITEPSRAREGPVRRDPNDVAHPIVRTHPVTGRKCIYLNKMFAHKIVGLTNNENKMLMDWFDDMIVRAQDLQCRMNHEKDTVVAWDNRNTIHSACMDSFDGSRRLVARITALAEVPVETEWVQGARAEDIDPNKL